MSDAEKTERERIRERKRRRLRERLATGSDADEDEEVSDDSDGADTPTQPVEVDGVAEFEELLDRYDVVLVDCYADWCGPCRMMEPTVDALARETDAAVATVDVDAHPELAQQLGARGVPTFLVYANGEAVDRFVGAQDRGTLESAIGRYLG